MSETTSVKFCKRCNGTDHSNAGNKLCQFYKPRKVASSSSNDDISTSLEQLSISSQSSSSPTKSNDGTKKNHVCDVCGKAFQYPSDLERHKVVHTGEKRYKCDICGKNFSRQGDLDRHRSTVHFGEKPYQCSEENCGKRFSHKHNLNRHINRKHTTERPYRCTQDGCDWAFATKYDLTRHMQIHEVNRPRPHKCTFYGCGWSFTTKQQLDRHLRIHTGEKPYHCHFDDCEQAFPQKSTLDTHLRTHTGERPFECDICFEKFTRSSHMYRHIERWHNERFETIKKKKENQIYELLRDQGYDFKPQQHIKFCEASSGSQSAYVDFYIQLKNSENKAFGVILEVDEFQHKESNYGISCDVRRMGEVMAALRTEGNEIPIIFIRYNPDSYEIGGIRTKRPKEEREEMLIEQIEQLKEGQYESGSYQIIYMFYDVNSEGDLLIHQDPEYDENMIELCTEVVF